MSALSLDLHPKQGEAFLSEATELLYGGAAGGGKSYLFRAAAISWAYAIPGLQVYLFRREFPDLYKNHMEGSGAFPEMLAAWIDAGHVKINYSKHQIQFWNGSKIHLCHCKHPKDVLGYQGAEIHVLMIDELTQWTADMYRYLRGRVRLGGLKVPAQYKGLFPRILSGANPGGIGHNWVKADFVDLGPPLSKHRMPKKEGGMLRQFIPARLEDNPTLTANDPDYEDRLEGLGNAALVKAMRTGDWDIVSGGMFDDVWDRRIHVLPRFEIPSSWRVDRSFDWGSSRPFSVGWWAESDGTPVEIDGEQRTFPRGTLIRVAEWYGWNGKPNEGLKLIDSEIAKGIKEREEALGLKVRPGPADSSIFDEKNGDSTAKQMQRLGVRWEMADKTPGSRIRGWDVMRRMFANAVKTPKENPGLYVFENCTQFIRTIPTLPRDQKNPDDVDTNAEDHIADETRYRVLAPRRAVGVEPIRGLI